MKRAARAAQLFARKACQADVAEYRQSDPLRLRPIAAGSMPMLDIIEVFFASIVERWALFVSVAFFAGGKDCLIFV